MQPSRWENQRERTGSLGQALSSSTRHNRISGRQQTASERLCHGRGSSVFQRRRRFVRGSHDQPSCRQRRPARPCVAAAARNGHAHWVSSASTRLARKIQRHSCDIFGGRRNKSAPAPIMLHAVPFGLGRCRPMSHPGDCHPQSSHSRQSRLRSKCRCVSWPHRPQSR